MNMKDFLKKNTTEIRQPTYLNGGCGEIIWLSYDRDEDIYMFEVQSSQGKRKEGSYMEFEPEELEMLQDSIELFRKIINQGTIDNV